jgi:molybdopterin/thiamine biosynthesis adenylyltransferase
MIEGLHNRQKDFSWFKQQQILIVGAGGIGGFTALALARINHRLHIFDMDIVEAHNIAAGQFFTTDNIGSRKTQALRGNIIRFSNNFDISTYGEYDEDSLTMPNTILAVDNMKVRKIAVEKWAKQYLIDGDPEETHPILTDGRLEGEQGIIYTLRSQEDVNRWMAEWFPDDEIEDGACTMRATSYNAMMIAANITAIFNNHIANIVAGDDIREVPFKLEYGFPGLMYDIVKAS